MARSSLEVASVGQIAESGVAMFFSFVILRIKLPREGEIYLEHVEEPTPTPHPPVVHGGSSRSQRVRNDWNLTN